MKEGLQGNKRRRVYDEPLVDVKVLRQIGCQTRGGRRAPDRFHVKVVGAMGPFHGQVFEVEPVGAQSRHGSKRRIGRRGIRTKTVSEEDGRGLHSSQRGRMFHSR